MLTLLLRKIFKKHYDNKRFGNCNIARKEFDNALRNQEQ